MLVVDQPGRRAFEARPATPAQRYRDAVWEADPDDLTPLMRLVALAYADHAGREGADRAWVANRRLRQRTGIRSNSTVTRIVHDLIAAGWLRQVGRSQRHRQSTEYQLVVPAHATVPVSGAESAPTSGADGGETAPISGAVRAAVYSEPHRSVSTTAPLVGADRTDTRYPPSPNNPLRAREPEGVDQRPPKTVEPHHFDPDPGSCREHRGLNRCPPDCRMSGRTCRVCAIPEANRARHPANLRRAA